MEPNQRAEPTRITTHGSGPADTGKTHKPQMSWHGIFLSGAISWCHSATPCGFLVLPLLILGRFFGDRHKWVCKWTPNATKRLRKNTRKSC
eukprot:5595406-Amphidinium_carterae.1